jgi:hypothetical protein
MISIKKSRKIVDSQGGSDLVACYEVVDRGFLVSIRPGWDKKEPPGKKEENPDGLS